MTLASLSSGRLAMPVAMALARWVPEGPLQLLADALADRFAGEVLRGGRSRSRQPGRGTRDLEGRSGDRPCGPVAVFRSAGRGHVALFRALARGREGADAAAAMSSPELIERIAIARSWAADWCSSVPTSARSTSSCSTIAARGFPMQALSPANPTATYRLQNDLRTKFGAETTPASTGVGQVGDPTPAQWRDHGYGHGPAGSAGRMDRVLRPPTRTLPIGFASWRSARTRTSCRA